MAALAWGPTCHAPRGRLPTSTVTGTGAYRRTDASGHARNRAGAPGPTAADTWGSTRDRSALQCKPCWRGLRQCQKSYLLGPLGPPAAVAGPPGGRPGLSDRLWRVLPSHALPSGDRPMPQCREGTLDPTSPLLLPSPGSRKAVTEKLPGGHEEAEDDHPGASRGERLWAKRRPAGRALKDQRALWPGGAELLVPLSTSQPVLPTALLPQKSWGTRPLQWPKSPQVPTHLSLGPQTW